MDLRYLDDVDALDVQRRMQRNLVKSSGALDRHALMSLLECAAAAEDTTQRQERAMRDLLAAMR